MKSEFNKGQAAYYTKLLNITEKQFCQMTDQQFDIVCFIYNVGSITPMDAFSKLDITKLSTRISEMRQMGIEFEQSYESRKNRYGKTVYFMRYRRAAA